MIPLNELQDRLKQMSYPDVELSLYLGRTEGIVFQVKGQLDDNFNKGEKFSFECNSFLPPMETLTQFDAYVEWRLRRIAIHEHKEKFKINGECYLHPHAEGADRDL